MSGRVDDLTSADLETTGGNKLSLKSVDIARDLQLVLGIVKTGPDAYVARGGEEVQDVGVRADIEERKVSRRAKCARAGCQRPYPLACGNVVLAKP